MIGFIIGAIVGAAIGAWAYRYTLKRDPAAVEKLADEAQKLGEKLKG